jgi:hypothetical protein
VQTLEKLREVGDSFGTITEFSEGYCCECARFGRIHDSNIDRNAFCIATMSTKFEPLAGWSATFVL